METKWDLVSLKNRYRMTQAQITHAPTPSHQNPNTINILSIDGGGFRNLISIIFLMELEQRSRRNVSALFNMVGGTSFGAIIAASLCCPSILNPKKPKYSSQELLNIWVKELPKIFSDDK